MSCERPWKREARRLRERVGGWQGRVQAIVGSPALGEPIPDNRSMDIGESKVPPAVAIGQLGVV